MRSQVINDILTMTHEIGLEAAFDDVVNLDDASLSCAEEKGLIGINEGPCAGTIYMLTELLISFVVEDSQNLDVVVFFLRDSTDHQVHFISYREDGRSIGAEVKWVEFDIPEMICVTFRIFRTRLDDFFKLWHFESLLRKRWNGHCGARDSSSSVEGWKSSAKTADCCQINLLISVLYGHIFLGSWGLKKLDSSSFRGKCGSSADRHSTRLTQGNTLFLPKLHSWLIEDVVELWTSPVALKLKNMTLV